MDTSQVVGGSVPAAVTVGVAVVTTGRATAVVPVVVGAVVLIEVYRNF